MRINDFALNSIQGSVFTASSWLLSPNQLGKLLEAVGKQFDGAPVFLPFGPDAPAEVPRAILKSNDQQWTLEIASSRLTYRWVQMAEAQFLKLEAFVEQFVNFLHFFLDMSSARSGRAGLVVVRYILAEDPATLVAHHFCREAWLKSIGANPENFEIHGHFKSKLSTLEVNSWTRFKSGLLTLPNVTPRRIMVVEQDVNTLEEYSKSKEFSLQDLRNFYSEAVAEVENRLRSFLET